MTQQVAIYSDRPSALAAYNEEEVKLLKEQIAPGTTDAQFSLFLEVARHKRLDPFKGQIVAIIRNSKRKGPNGKDIIGSDGKAIYDKKMTIQTTLDGMIAIAARSGLYEGTTEALFCGEDGVWKDVWLSKAPPIACKIGVWKRGVREPIYATAKWSEFVQTEWNSTEPTGLWKSKGTHMLEKCTVNKAMKRAGFDIDDAAVNDQDIVLPPDVDVETGEIIEAQAVPAERVVRQPVYEPDASVEAEYVEAETPDDEYEEVTAEVVQPTPEPVPVPAPKARKGFRIEGSVTACENGWLVIARREGGLPVTVKIPSDYDGPAAVTPSSRHVGATIQCIVAGDTTPYELVSVAKLGEPPADDAEQGAMPL